jgi:sugar phosphate isomerase/epimerase
LFTPIYGRKLKFTKEKKILKSVFQEVKAYAKKYGIKLSLENLSYASSGYGKNVDELEEVFSILDDSHEGITGLTLDLSHAMASGTAFSLLEKYHNRLCNVHMSNRTHKAFTEENANLMAFLSKLKEYDYDGPITLELSRKSKTEDILKTKSVVESALKKSGFYLEK